MTLEIKGTAKRQSNGSCFFPQWIWERLNIQEGEEFNWSLEAKKKGLFIAFYKKEE